MTRSTPGGVHYGTFHKLSALTLLLALAACDQELPTGSSEAAQVPVNASAVQSDERFIVLFSDHVQDAAAQARQLVQAHGGTQHYTYSRVARGFAASLPAAAVEALRRNPNVASVEPDIMVTTSDVQNGATWGLDRIDQRALPLSGSYDFSHRGGGVTAYIIDTGIRYTHTEFGGRAVFGYDALGSTGADCNGHGTHVAGTVGGSTFGVAKAVTLVSVRVLDCNGSGYLSGVVAGIDWVASNHAGPSVANLSLGASANSTLNQAIARLVASGVVAVVAAGNANGDACSYSPASAPAAITVGATDQTDTRASFSNYGSCVDLFAPGVGITSSLSKQDGATGSMSGTSMAAPHAAGAAALVLERNPSATPQAVADSLGVQSTKGVVKSASSANNHLLFSPSAGTVAPPPPPPSNPPAPAISLTASGRKVKNARYVDLTWSGATASTVDVFRNGVRIAATANDGSFTDSPSGKGGMTLTYRVCDTGTSRCSPDAVVAF